jgi:hypothetical protein
MANPRIKGQGGEIRPAVKAALKVDELVYQFENVDVPDGVLETGSAEEINQKFDDAHLVGEARNRLDLINDQLEDIDQDSHPVDFKIFSRDQRQLINFIKRFEGSTLEQAAPQDQPNLPALLGPPEEPGKKPSKGGIFRGIGSLMRRRMFPLIQAAQAGWGALSPEAKAEVEAFLKRPAHELVGMRKPGIEYFKEWLGISPEDLGETIPLPGPSQEVDPLPLDKPTGLLNLYHATPVEGPVDFSIGELGAHFSENPDLSRRAMTLLGHEDYRILETKVDLGNVVTVPEQESFF